MAQASFSSLSVFRDKLFIKRSNLNFRHFYPNYSLQNFGFFFRKMTSKRQLSLLPVGVLLFQGPTVDFKFRTR